MWMYTHGQAQKEHVLKEHENLVTVVAFGEGNWDTTD